MPLVGLEQVIERTIKEGVFQTSEIQGRQGRWYEARVWPHRTPDREIVGSVVALIDVDLIKQAMAAVASARDFSAATVETAPTPTAGPRQPPPRPKIDRAFTDLSTVSRAGRAGFAHGLDADIGTSGSLWRVWTRSEPRMAIKASRSRTILSALDRESCALTGGGCQTWKQHGEHSPGARRRDRAQGHRSAPAPGGQDAARGQLASGVAHEVNNQAQADLGFSAVHESLDVQDPRRSDSEQVIKAATRSGEIAQGLLAFSRQKQLHPEVLDVKTVVASDEPLLCG